MKRKEEELNELVSKISEMKERVKRLKQEIQHEDILEKFNKGSILVFGDSNWNDQEMEIRKLFTNKRLLEWQIPFEFTFTDYKSNIVEFKKLSLDWVSLKQFFEPFSIIIHNDGICDEYECTSDSIDIKYLKEKANYDVSPPCGSSTFTTLLAVYRKEPWTPEEEKFYNLELDEE